MILKTDLLLYKIKSFLLNNTEYPPTHHSMLIKMSLYRKRKESVTVVTVTDTYPYQKGRKKYIFKIWTWKMEKMKDDPDSVGIWHP